MKALTRDLPEVNLALSLHAPNQRMREEIVPSARGTPIELLIEALDEHMMAILKQRRRDAGNPQGDQDVTSSSEVKTTDEDEFNEEERVSASKKKRAMIEYVMLTGDTSTIEAAHQLGQLCKGRHLVVNLIPYNKTNVKDKLSCPSEEHMQEFRNIVSSYGSFCTIRRTMGADIAGACGQLVVEEEKKQNAVLDIEDYGSIGKTTDGIVGKKEKRSSTVTRKSNQSERLDSEDTVKSEEDEPLIWKLKLASGIAVAGLVVSSTLLLVQKRKR